MNFSRIVLGLALVSFCMPALSVHGEMVPVNLRCEYRTEPLGIDETAPRLSWQLMETDPDAKDRKQTAYQILVADSEALLLDDSGNLWDTGKVESDAMAQIEYAGKPLESGMQCWWKVRVWDEEGKVVQWSKPSSWTMGVLSPDEWKGEWLGYQAAVEEATASEHSLEELTFNKCRWVWSTGRKAREEAPEGTIYLRKEIEVPENQAVQEAGILITVDDRFMLYVNGEEAGRSDGEADAWKRPQRIDLKPYLKPGANVFAIEASNDSPSPAGAVAKLVIRFESGETFTDTLDDTWKMGVKKEPGWKDVGFQDEGWKKARIVCDIGKPPWNIPGSGGSLYLPPPAYLRKEFQTGNGITRAYVHVSALGLYELRLNGQRVGTSYFTPGWSDYNKRVYYNTYEVEDLLVEGRNAIGAILADGWYSGYVGWGCTRERYGEEPRFTAELHIEYLDGREEIVVSDGTWKGSFGPLIEADLLMGERYDARREIPGWDRAGFDDNSWNSVTVSRVNTRLESYPGVTVQKMEELRPKSITKSGDKWIFDLGQNMVGWARLNGAAPEGTEVSLRFGEMLNPDGSLYTTNLRGARATDSYIFKGKGTETWEPRFTFHGFRYVELSGYPGEPTEGSVTGVVLHSATPRTGHFSCSNEMVNQLFHNILWGQKGNYFEVPTDCPQRDERLGWTGDAQVFINTAAYNMDIASFFTKWLVDLEDSQLANGAFAHVAPNVGLDGGSPAWSDAGIICPYAIYQFYGDTKVIEDHYDAMVRYMDYLKNNSKEYRRPESGYGDWLSLNAPTPKELIGTAYFAYVARLMAEMSEVIGKVSESREYTILSDRVSEVFRNAYIDENGTIAGDTQTAYALALAMDLLKVDAREAAARRLVQKIEERDWHVSTGFVGLPLLLPTLTRYGYNDIAHRLLLNDSYPSWGYEIKHGATTIWERWDGWTEDKGFQNPGMNSFNHYAYGAVGEWMYRTVGGISASSPGFREIIIEPKPEDSLTHAETEYESISGKIVTRWWNDAENFRLEVEIPVNTVATVRVPFGGDDEEQLGSGRYEFEVKKEH